MNRNIWLTAFRVLKRNAIFSLLNIVGLGISLACCLLMVLYIKDEWSFDQFHRNQSRIYQLVCDRLEKDGARESFGIAAMVQGPAFKRDIPGIEAFVRVCPREMVIRAGKRSFTETVTWTDSNFFQVFTFPLLQGNPGQVLAGMHNLVLTPEMARKYFGPADPIGKSLELELNGRFEPFEVSGIAAPAPPNSSLQFNIVLPFAYWEQASPDNGWMWVSYPTYFLLDPHSDPGRIASGMEKVYRLQAREEIDLNHLAGYDNRFVWGLQPLSRMHLQTRYQGVPQAGDPLHSYILAGLTAFILLIACINFVNLSLARSVNRAKEVGVRKVLGGRRPELVKQFLGESALLCFLAFLLAILLALILLPVFNSLSAKHLYLGYLFDLRLVGLLVLILALTILGAGFYPALVLSGFSPVQALQSRLAKGSSSWLTKGLVVFQFTVASFLIIATLFLFGQFNYIRKADLGYEEKNLVECVIEKAIQDPREVQLIKEQFGSLPGVVAVSCRNVGKFGGRTRAGGRQFAAVYDHIDEDYLPALGIKLLAGRNFSSRYPTDSTQSVLVNESFARAAGWTDPIGRTVDFMNFPGWGNRKITVVGLVRDYHFESLRSPIKPQVFTLEPGLPLGDFLIRIRPDQQPATLAALEKVFHGLVETHPFEYSFRSEAVQKDYATENRWKLIIGFCALLSVLISCSGLFGLSLHAVEKRKKELSLRKLLGGSTFQLISLFCREFLLLVGLALLLAIPLSAWWVALWLDNFAYRINLSPGYFAMGGSLALFIALGTVAFNAFRAAGLNPVDSLRRQ